MRFLLPFLAALVALPAAAERLTLDRLQADPALSGPNVNKLTVSPDGERVTFLRARDDDRMRMDLWEYNVKAKSIRQLVDSRKLAPEEKLSLEEKARRERTHTAGLSGIVSYSWSPDGKQLLVPIAGDLYLIDIARPDAPRKIASGDVGDPQISPKGRYVSFIRAQNLFVIELATGRERQLTRDGKGTIHNAEAEFVAQEEMFQTSGYYWAPDDSAIAYKRFDEAPVPVTRRFEIFADRTEVVEQRYPAAGQPNVLVGLRIVDPVTGKIRQVDIGADKDIYLVRADWSADAKTLVYQRQPRSLKRLDLVAVDAATLAQRPLLSETSRTWINVPADLHFLKKRNAFIWSSERSGRNHLYLFDMSGRLLHPISQGDWGVDNVLAVDEQAGKVYIASNKDAVTDKQAYVLNLDGSNAGTPLRITQQDGWHEDQFARNGKIFVDTFSDPKTPPQVSIRSADGGMLAWLEHNELNANHPYAKYLPDHLPTEYGSIKASDGQDMYYSMIKPAHFDPGKRYPVFLYVYGGPGVQIVTRKWQLGLDQYMAQQGFLVFALDSRGSARRERAFTDVIYGDLGKHEVEDQLTGIDWLARQSFVDPKRIGVYGWSYGGFMALRLLEAGSDRIALGVSGAPVTDWSSYDTYYTERFMGGTPASAPDAYRQTSVFANLDGLKSPLLLMHGMADDNVLFTNSTRLMDALVNRNVQFELMTYPGAKHGISTRAGTRHRLGMIASFFMKHLGDGAR